MGDAFSEKTLSPMLIGASAEPFDKPGYIYELKLDGERGLAYVDREGVELRNKRNMRMLRKFPELGGLHRLVRERCILDGEYVALVDGKPDYGQVQRRSLMNNEFRIDLHRRQVPISFVAFDILYLGDRLLTHLPLLERKALLERTVEESEELAISRYLESGGRGLFAAAKERKLEGIVAKRRESLYHPGKRTTDWVKIKNLQDDDYIVLGYIEKAEGVVSLVLGQLAQTGMLYCGHVTLGISDEAFARICQLPPVDPPFCPVPPGTERARWLEPRLVCTVQYLVKSESGSLRHAVFKALRPDKEPEDCRAE